MARTTDPATAAAPRLPSPDQLRVREPPARRRLPIAAVLMVGFGGLVAVAVASVLYLGLVSAGRNTFELIHDAAIYRLDTIETHIRDLVQPTETIAAGIAGAIAAGVVDRGDPGQIADHLRGVVTGAPQISGALFSDRNFDTVIADRREDGSVELIEDNRSADPNFVYAFEQARFGGGWGRIIWQPELEEPLLPYVAPVRIDGELVGLVGIYVDLGRIVGFVSDLSLWGDAPVFVLHGEDRVLAHSRMADRGWIETLDADGANVALPRLDALDDPVLTMLARGDVEEDRTLARHRPRGSASRVLSLPKEGRPEYTLIIRRIAGYGPAVWTLAQQFRSEDVSAPAVRLLTMAIAGLAILIVAVGLALWLGRRMTRRIGGLARAAESLRTLDFANAADVPDSRFRELAHAGQAFNAMMVALRWFEMYVPKSLVLRLMQRGDTEVITTRERPVTVMFTDIRGFSALSQRLSAPEMADLLNDHFDLLSRRIEAAGGTVDKFIGDSVMAFWGAPDEQPDHAERALEAARGIREAMAADNAERTERGQAPIQVRIGINTGPAVVGNIGSSSRVNYTLIGDTVNVAERLERLAAELLRDEDVIVLASAATAEAASAPLQALGRRELRGLSGSVEVYRLA